MKNDAIPTTSTTETVTISRAEYEELKQTNEHLANMNNWLREQLENLKKNTFGSKHEGASDEVIGQMLLFDEPEAYAFLEEIRNKTTSVAAHERVVEKERVFLLDRLPENAEVVVEVHELRPEERVCPECGAAQFLPGR